MEQGTRKREMRWIRGKLKEKRKKIKAEADGFGNDSAEDVI